MREVKLCAGWSLLAKTGPRARYGGGGGRKRVGTLSLTCVGLCWAALAVVGLRWPLLGCVGLHWSSLGCVGPENPNISYEIISKRMK